MRVCFIHQNMPAQYRHLIAALLERGDQVQVIGSRPAIDRWPLRHPRLQAFGYGLPDAAVLGAVPAHLQEFHAQTARGEAVVRGLRRLRADHGRPDVIVVHPGWGEALFVRTECPEVPVLGYCEFFYRAVGADVGFDPEYPVGADTLRQLQIRKLPHLLALDDIDAGLCPTEWQRAQFPEAYRSKLEVVHEGIDTDTVRPDPQALLRLGDWTLRAGEPIVTYVARNLEPYRGFHVFMRSLPRLQQRVPQARIVVVGGDEVSYGRRLPAGESYRQRLTSELGDRIDASRILVTGKLPYAQYLRLLQVSAVHAYLTYPFVLSWSLLEALSAGCCVVASRTPPVEEVLQDGVNGLLVDFFDTDGLAGRLADVLTGRVGAGPLRAAGRATVVERYDLRRVCLPAGLALLDRLAAQATPAIRGPETRPNPVARDGSGGPGRLRASHDAPNVPPAESEFA